MKLNLALTAAALIAASPPALIAASAQQVGTYRTELQRHDLSAAGREVIQVRVDLDPGTVAPRHRHPAKRSSTSLRERGSTDSRASPR